VAARGWIGLTWPKEYGGHERSFVDRSSSRGDAALGAPAALHWFADRQIGGGICATATRNSAGIPAAHHPGRTVRGLGMSEPEAVDLASLSTKARNRTTASW
jgi:alkylation response protein AidB-like acyl-CoA dehydrogenase